MTVASAGHVSFSPWWNLKSNTSLQLLPEAGARHERTLEAVSSRPLFGLDDVRTSPPSYQLRCFSRGATTGSEPFVSSTAISRAGRDGPFSVSAS